MSFSQTTLNNWQFRQAGELTWKKARAGYAATEIHPDLHANGDIPDPFIDDNEKSLVWIGEKDWEYQTSFLVDAEAKADVYELFFEGLDTFADVYVNEKKVLTTQSMFIEHRINVNDVVKVGQENNIRIYFKSALLEARKLEKIHGKLAGFNGESSRMQIRKAGYHYGWDWGPLFMTCGPCRPIRFQCYSSKIVDVYPKIELSDDLNVANIDLQCDIDTETDVELNIVVKLPSNKEVKTISGVQVSKSGVSSTKFAIENPELWWPFTHGPSDRYTFSVDLVSSGTTLHQWSREIGIRKLELVQETFKEQKGSSFYFKINNVPVYCSGSDWIPAHSFQTSLSDEDYKEWMQVMVDGHQNMIRIWGGGYYERDVLYEECDRKGILIWHDMMFACGQYPCYPEYLDLVKQETECQLKRLRNYCSMTIITGNNEDYQVAEQCGLEWNPKDTSGDYTKTSFPARTLYETVFPEYVKNLCCDIPYHPGSPWGGDGTADPTIGDLHQWNVWHGTQEPYQDWYKLGGRFVSEFGMEALPSRKTYEDCITDETELYPQSALVDHHNKADGFERRLALYVIENIKLGGLDFDSWIYATQLMQAECLGYAYRCWRREWRGDGKRYLGGTIVWQINDCWPCASWAIVDFYKRPKLGYYSVKRESQPLGVGLYRNVIKPEDEWVVDPFDYRPITYLVDIWGVNSSTKDVPATLKIDLYNVTSGEKLESLPDKEVILAANQTSEFHKDLHIPSDIPVVVYARIVKKDGSIIASAGDWPQPLKYLKFPGRKVDVKIEDGLIRLNANKPVKGVELLVEKDLYVEDNGFDIFPGDEKVVKVRGLLSNDKVSIQYYQMSK